MDVVIPTNLVHILFDPAAIPTSSFNLFNCFYTCIIMSDVKASLHDTKQTQEQDYVTRTRGS